MFSTFPVWLEEGSYEDGDHWNTDPRVTGAVGPLSPVRAAKEYVKWRERHLSCTSRGLLYNRIIYPLTSISTMAVFPFPSSLPFLHTSIISSSSLSIDGWTLFPLDEDAINVVWGDGFRKHSLSIQHAISSIWKWARWSSLQNRGAVWRNGRGRLFFPPFPSFNNLYRKMGEHFQWGERIVINTGWFMQRRRRK